MALPVGVPTVTVVDSRTHPDGGPMRGRIVLRPEPALITNPDGGHIVLGDAEARWVDGELTLTVIAVDAPGYTPTGWTYTVFEYPDDAPMRSYPVLLTAALGPTVDLAALAPVAPYTGDYVLVPGPPGPAGPPGSEANAQAYTDAQIATRAPASGQPDLPSEQGLLAWTYDPNMAGHVTAQSNAGVAGRITLVRLILRKQITWSNVWLGLSGVDAAAVLANCYLGVYDSAGTLKGATADVSTSLMSGAVAKPLPLVTPFTAAAGTYFIAMLLNGTWATNSLTFKASGAGVSVNAGLAAPNLRYSNMLSAQTSLPSSLTLSGQTTTIINTGWASQWYGVS